MGGGDLRPAGWGSAHGCHRRSGAMTTGELPVALPFRQGRGSEAEGRRPEIEPLAGSPRMVCLPPACNHGGKVASEFERRELDRVRPDWVRVTFSDTGLSDVLEVVSRLFGFGVEAFARERGLIGFTSLVEFKRGGVVFARYAFGGHQQRGRAMVEVSGAACERVAAWGELVEFAEARAGRLTRLDLCLDSDAVTVEAAIAAWRAGEFKARGRPPSASLVDDLGSGRGRTFYVGRRGGDRFLRVYEKGRQLGEAGSTWVRVELELLAATSVLPLAGMLDAEALFAGAYSWLASLIGAAGTRPERVKRATVVEVGRAVEVARQQVGGVIGWLTGVAGWPVAEVVRMLWAPPSARIAGVADVEFASLCRTARVEFDPAFGVA